jgi:hypothetical protein
MKTSDLIEALANDARAVQPVRRLALIAAGLGLAGAALVYAFGLGPRPDFAAAFGSWRFVLKLVIVTVALAVAAREFLRLMRPDAALSIWPAALVGAMLALAALIEVLSLPSENWGSAAIGRNAAVCLITIPLLSVLPLAAALWAMRSGAPSSPGAAGAIAGAVSAALAASLYATHCPDDSPLFVGLWYSLASAMVIGAGALLGRQILRW